MKNSSTEPLETFSFDEMAEALDVVVSESAEIDFKAQMVPRTELVGLRFRQRRRRSHRHRHQ